MNNTRTFLDKHFLLSNDTAGQLYFDYAKDLPIIDYHNHLPPAEIAGNRRFANITEAWLEGDHYKWRAMRTLGVDEHYITGDASPLEKFQKWAETVPYTLRNPLFHWTHLELQRYFDIDAILDASTGREIYDATSTMLNSDNYGARNLLEHMKVEIVCSTDDPIDSLEHHRAYGADNHKVKMYPAFRPDKAILIQNQGFVAYLEKLGSVSGTTISSLDDLLTSLLARADFFHANGCRLADHGLEQMYATDFTDTAANLALQKCLNGQEVSTGEAEQFMSAVLYHLCCKYHALGWTQQFHVGALRNNNRRMEQTLGPDTGFDSIGDFSQAQRLSRFMDRLDGDDKLTKTIVYNLNPADNAVFAAMVGNFNDGSVKGKVQYGAAWWFLDQKHGMTQQIEALSNMGLLSCFVGMLTDSRSFLSFPRHEYFRRLLCDIIGTDVENGELPGDIKWLGKIVQDICYFNAKSYFGFHTIQLDT